MQNRYRKWRHPENSENKKLYLYGYNELCVIIKKITSLQIDSQNYKK